jgi:diguanylate cyclase (GGDEF)-like protein
LETLGSSLAWVTFYPAVMVAAILGGRSAGLLATFLAFLSVSIGWPLFAPSHFMTSNADRMGMVVFILTGLEISIVSHVTRAALARVDALMTLVRAMDEGFCVVEMIYGPDRTPVDYRFLETNPAFEAQTGLHEPKGKTIKQMAPGLEDHWFEIYGQVAQTGRSIRFENHAGPLGRYYDVFAFRVGGHHSRRVGIHFKDITARRKTQEQLLLSAQYDELTGLTNRARFNEYLDSALARASRSRQNLALLFIDLDDFKAVNDRFGHQAGDRLLRLVAQRLRSCLRAGDLVSRLGGDEFTVVLENCELDHLPALAETIVEVLGVPVDLGGHPVRVSASIGIATYPASGASQDELIHKADAAMYCAKESGKNRYRIAS